MTRQDDTTSEQTCPPCHGDCMQGRECPARLALPPEDDDDEYGEDLTPLEKAQVGSAIVFALCVLGAVVVLLLRGCLA